MVIGGWVAFTSHSETTNVLKFEVVRGMVVAKCFYLLPALKLRGLQWLQFYQFTPVVFFITFPDIVCWKFVLYYSSYWMES